MPNPNWVDLDIIYLFTAAAVSGLIISLIALPPRRRSVKPTV